MAQIRNATGLRLTLNQNWKNLWYSKKNSSKSLIEDIWVSTLIKNTFLKKGLINNQLLIKRRLSNLETKCLIVKKNK